MPPMKKLSWRWVMAKATVSPFSNDACRPPDEFFGHAVFIGVGYIHRCRGDFPRADELLQFRGILQSIWSQY
jgi:hypothetical protein